LTEAVLLRVFVHAPGGGNPVPLVADARGMNPFEMQQVAALHGHESAFVLPAANAHADWRLRFFVPQHEMEMCGHATVGTLWALRQWGRWRTPDACIETLSGPVDAQWDAARQRVWISQPTVRCAALSPSQREQVAAALGLASAEVPMINARTSRTKTLVRLRNVEALQRLRPAFATIAAVCEATGSTGLYPYAMAGGDTVFARQFPRASGYPEDAATGIAAAALWGHLVSTGELPIGTPVQPALCTVRQGDAMGRPSAIELRPRFDDAGRLGGCWLGGRVEWMTL
jgi:PhzF family phenazine biosynthesis protein